MVPQARPSLGNKPQPSDPVQLRSIDSVPQVPANVGPSTMSTATTENISNLSSVSNKNLHPPIPTESKLPIEKSLADRLVQMLAEWTEQHGVQLSERALADILRHSEPASPPIQDADASGSRDELAGAKTDEELPNLDMLHLEKEKEKVAVAVTNPTSTGRDSSENKITAPQERRRRRVARFRPSVEEIAERDGFVIVRNYRTSS